MFVLIFSRDTNCFAAFKVSCFFPLLLPHLRGAGAGAGEGALWEQDDLMEASLWLE